MEVEREEARGAVAALERDGSTLAVSARMCAILGLEGDGRQALERQVRATDLVAALRAGARWRGALVGPQGPVAAEAESAGGLGLLWLVDAPERQEPQDVGPLLAVAQAQSFPRLADGLVHDVRNPLNALAIYVEVLADSLKAASNVPEATTRQLQAMREQVRRIEALLKRFWRFVSPRSETGSSLDLAELVQQAVEACLHDARRRTVQVDTHLDAARVEGDVAALGRAVLQLVQQGIDSGAEGGRLEIAVGRRGAEAVLSLLDLPPASPASPAPTSSAAEPAPVAVAHALLAAAQQVVELHHGQLTSASDGEGRRVEVRLPLSGGTQPRERGAP